MLGSNASGSALDISFLMRVLSASGRDGSGSVLDMSLI